MKEDSTAATGATARRTIVGAIAITGAAQFMASLDNLVVTTALPVIRARLHAGLAGLDLFADGLSKRYGQQTSAEDGVVGGDPRRHNATDAALWTDKLAVQLGEEGVAVELPHSR